MARWFDRHPFIYRGPLGTRRSLAVIRVDLARLPVGKLLDEERPSLALLAAAAHARGPRAKARRVAERALRVARKGGGSLAPALVDVILQVVDARLRQELEEVMERQGFRTDWLQDAYLKGKTEGEAKAARRALARVLSRRGIALTARQQARIEAEESVERLEGWLDAAVTATELAEVFTDAPPSPGSRRRAAGAGRSARAGAARASGARSRARASSSR